jgi:hypothetical protein
LGATANRTELIPPQMALAGRSQLVPSALPWLLQSDLANHCRFGLAYRAIFLLAGIEFVVGAACIRRVHEPRLEAAESTRPARRPAASRGTSRVVGTLGLSHEALADEIPLYRSHVADIDVVAVPAFAASITALKLAPSPASHCHVRLAGPVTRRASPSAVVGV